MAFENLTLVEVAYILIGDEAEEVLRLGRDEVQFKRYLILQALKSMYSVDEDEFRLSLSVSKPPTFEMGVIALYDANLYSAILYAALKTRRKMPRLSVRQAVAAVCSNALARDSRR